MQSNRGRPKREGNLHRIYLRDVVLATWNKLKDEFGWGSSTHNEFAEFLLDSLQGIAADRPTSSSTSFMSTTTSTTIATHTDDGEPRRTDFHDKSFVCSTPLVAKKRSKCMEER